MLPMHNKSLGKPQRRLLELFEQLAEQDQASLLAFAEFLLARADADGEAAERGPAAPLQPEHEPRPERESVVAAIKRLSRIYHMLPRQDLLNETSSLMSAHVLQGRAAADVVDELETVFQAHYDRYLQQWED